MRKNTLSALHCALALSVAIAAVSRAAEPIHNAGLSTPGTPAYPVSIPYRTAGTELFGGVDAVNCGVTDAANGYTYLGVQDYDISNPGRIYKINLGLDAAVPSRVATLRLAHGENPRIALLDLVHGYAYFAARDDSTLATKLIKVALGTGDAVPTRVGECSFPLLASEELGCGAIDPAGGYAYFGTRAHNPAPPQTGRVFKIALNPGAAAPTLVGNITLNAGENDLYSMAIDPVSGYAFFGTFTSPGIVVKVALGSGGAVPTRVNALSLAAGTDEAYLTSAAIDPTKGYVYFGNGDPDGVFGGASPHGLLIKLRVGVGDNAPIKASVLDTGTAVNDFNAAQIDTVSGIIYLYWNKFIYGSSITKISLEAGDATPVYVTNFPDGPGLGVPVGIDTTSGYLYAGGTGGSSLTTGEFAKMRLNGPTENLSIPQDNFIYFSAQQDNFFTAAVHHATGHAYFVMPSPGYVFQTNLSDGISGPTITNTHDLGDNNQPLSSVINSTGTYMYVGHLAGKVRKVNLNNMGSPNVDIGIGASQARVAAIDANDKYVYFCDSNGSFNGGAICKVGTGENGIPYGQIDAQDFNAGQIGCAVIDTPHGYGYFGTYSGNIIRVKLNGDGQAMGPVAANEIISVTPGFALISAILDSAGGYAYFAAADAVNPGRIVKVKLSGALPVLESTTILAPAETNLRAFVMDKPNDCGYLVANYNYAASSVIKIALGSAGAPVVRLGAAPLNDDEQNVMSGSLDSATGLLYLACRTVPAHIAVVATAFHSKTRATRVLIPDDSTLSEMNFYSHSASGNVRLALYNDALPKQLVWQSEIIPNTAAGANIVVPISAGSPASVTLPAGQYWLAWQSSSSAAVGSYSQGNFGDGFSLDVAFGSYPATASNETITDERWTQYLTYFKRPTFEISGFNTQVAGSSQGITITAKDRLGAIQSDYFGTKTLIVTGAHSTTNPVFNPTLAGQPFDQQISVDFSGGTASPQLFLYKVENASVSVVDTYLNATTSIPLNVDVTPDTVDHFSISGTSTVLAGTTNSLTLTAQDSFGNTRSDYTGSHDLTFDGAHDAPAGDHPLIAGSLLATAVSVTFTNGQAVVSSTLYAAETASITVTDQSISENQAFDVTVLSKSISKFGLSGNSTQTAGTTQIVTVFALDQYGNTAEDQNGPLNVTFSGAATSPFGNKPTANGQDFGTTAPLFFANGIVSVPVILVTTAAAASPAALVVNSSGFTTPSPLSVVVGPGPAASFQLSGLSNQTQNVSRSLVLNAKDSFGNFANTYTGTVAYSSSDPLASLPANKTFNPNDAEAGVSVPETLRTTGAQIVTATDVNNSGLTKSFNIFVAAGTPGSITVFAGNSQTATVGTAFTADLKAKVLDGSSNPLAGASVTFTAPSSGASGSFDGATTVLTDGAGVATAPSFTANTLPGAYTVSANVGITPANFSLTNTVDLPVSIVATAGNNQTATIGSAFSTALKVAVRDRFNNPVPAVNVTFTAPTTGPGGTFASSSPVATDSSGIATATTLTANTNIGAFSATATAGALSTTFNLNSVNDVPVATPQTLSVVENNPLAITLAGTDVNSANLVFTVVSTPQHGTLSGTVPNLTYTPDTDYRGPDSFMFKVNDGLVDSAAATISISVQANTSVPTVTSISQTAGTINQQPFTLTVTGTNYVSGSIVLWNGQPLSTTFGSITQLTASVTATQLANAGRISISVQNPVPNFANSNTATYFLYSGAVGTWNVTNTDDSGDGSLRLALASCRSGDRIVFDPVVFDLTSSDAATLINVLSELPHLNTGSVTIDAQDRRVSVNGSGAGSACGLTLESNNNVIMGLTIVGFQRSAVCVQGGAKSNVIGGNRTLGTGPNGQGLRLSSNGTFGVEISDSGTTSNVVKGCWIGLDATGLSAQPNLAGILIQSGAGGNTIGSTVSGEENIISGNTFEGVTVSGLGSDSNVVIGNIVGASAVASSATARSVSARADDSIGGRSSVGNGSAGVFLSKGTQSSRVGGVDTRETNTIGFNGGNGVEVRAQESHKNSSTSNSISRNRRGGIALFDGSNDGVKAPVFDSVVPTGRVGGRGVSSRDELTAVISGRAAGGGTVEVFGDPNDQGERLIGRVGVVNGAWTVQGTVLDTDNITGTYTDDNGNTSSFAFYGRSPVPASGGAYDDSDGDGISDMLEVAAGTDPFTAADTSPQGALTSVKFGVSLSFVVTGKDSIRASLQLALPQGAALAGAGVSFQIDGLTKSVTLNSKGALTGDIGMKFTTKKGATTSILALQLKNQNLRTALSQSGLIDKTAVNEAHTLPLALILSSGTTKYSYTGSVNVTYKATQGKSGKAK